MVTVNVVVCETCPEVPVIVIGTLTEGLEVVVETFSVDVPVLPEDRGTLEGKKAAVTPVAVGGIEAVRATVPVNPMLVREMVELTELPATTVLAVGEALAENPGRTRKIPSMLVKCMEQ